MDDEKFEGIVIMGGVGLGAVGSIGSLFYAIFVPEALVFGLLGSAASAILAGVSLWSIAEHI